MNRVTLDLENCYGIKRLKTAFDFSQRRAYAIYAPNGSMKSSFAAVFRDIEQGRPSKDAIFPSRVSKRDVRDEHGKELAAISVLAIRPYSSVFGESTQTSTLLVDDALRQEYVDLNKDVVAARQRLLGALVVQSGTKKVVDKEIAATFTKDNILHTALKRIQPEVAEMKTAPFKDVRYDKIFDEKVLDVLSKSNVKAAIAEYVRKYNELLAASTYFRKGIFNYHQASTIAKSLADNGFFQAQHSVRLNAQESLEITSQKELEDVIQKEKDSITKDKELKKKFAELDKLLYKNVTVRDFNDYLSQDESILPQLDNVALFRELVWKSYIKANEELYDQYLKAYDAAAERRHHIEEAARQQRTQWEEVIDIFNDRFYVPFKLVAENRTQAILGQEMPVLGFTFHDGQDNAAVQQKELLDVLSTGEAKALYILNLIFEIQVRSKAAVETLLIIDDLADSFDYKNKYAIIEYLKDISDNPLFKQIILTHNFDFFRTLESRKVVGYKQCLMAFKTSAGLELRAATGFKNVFVKDWKGNFFTDARKRIASVAFMRNMLEYTKGEQNSDYIALTSLLHITPQSAAITQADLDAVYNRMFDANGHFPDPGQNVIPWIHDQAKDCLEAAAGVNLENKIVLSIAIRLAADDYMIRKINDPGFWSSISENQTTALLRRFKQDFPAESTALKIIEKVGLMTPENIHLNSFMYEPILDMSDEHLRRLYADVLALNQPVQIASGN
jgi:hypothetical protein